ncbi:MAG: glycosyltransferase family 9 protein [Bacteroidia bacterium]|nr:glycosyltransferase family 9 protein [Bacteroidia bacterium]
MRFLFVRLSSMGDVVLTTPLIRALHQRFPEAKLHFMTRAPYGDLVRYHPYLEAIHEWPPSAEVRLWHWTGVIDLQKSLRTLTLRWRLRYERFSTFPKKNLQKWLMVRFKRVIPLSHIVERYGMALRPWGILPETLGPLEVYIPESIRAKLRHEMAALQTTHPWIAVGLGGTYRTKRWLIPYYEILLSRLKLPVVLLGGNSEASEAHELATRLSVPVIVGAGRFSLLETAAAIQLSDYLITHDTGTAHLGAAMQTPTAVIWGNTVPEFGMTPWKVRHVNIELEYLRCRPCSKLGFDRCPQGHHDCIRALTPDYVEEQLRHAFHISRLA